MMAQCRRTGACEAKIERDAKMGKRGWSLRVFPQASGAGELTGVSPDATPPSKNLTEGRSKTVRKRPIGDP